MYYLQMYAKFCQCGQCAFFNLPHCAGPTSVVMKVKVQWCFLITSFFLISRQSTISTVLCLSCHWALSLSLLAPLGPECPSPRSSLCCGQPMPKRRLSPPPPCLWEAEPMLLWVARRVLIQFKQVWICSISWHCSRAANRGSLWRRWSSGRWPITAKEGGCWVSESRSAHWPASPAAMSARSSGWPQKDRRRRRSKSAPYCKWQTWGCVAGMTGDSKLRLTLCKVCVFVQCLGFQLSPP